MNQKANPLYTIHDIKKLIYDEFDINRTDTGIKDKVIKTLFEHEHYHLTNGNTLIVNQKGWELLKPYYLLESMKEKKPINACIKSKTGDCFVLACDGKLGKNQFILSR